MILLDPHGWTGKIAVAVLLVLLFLPVPGTPQISSQASTAESPLLDPAEFEAFLVTYGPGEVYWQRFGHNAIWLREPARGLDHTVNFGFFDFEQENFLLNFVRGRMLYFAAAVEADREFDFYRAQDRSIRVQRLALDRDAFNTLRDDLLNSVLPANREYLYDYYLDNCSTRLRDALDRALGGALSDQFKPQPGLQNFRDHTRRSTENDWDYYLGLELALGLPVDRDISRWDEMFLPALLAESMMEVTRLNNHALSPLVVEDAVIFQGQGNLPAAEPTPVWYRYLALGTVLAVLATLTLWVSPRLTELLMQGWLMLGGILGLGLLLVWLGTDHLAARPNLNLLLFSPVMLLGWLPSLRRWLGAWMVLCSVIAAGLLFLPGGQYMHDVLALVLPLHVLAAYRLLRFEPAASRRG